MRSFYFPGLTCSALGFDMSVRAGGADRSVAVVVTTFGDTDRNDIELPVPNASLGNYGFRETSYAARGALENDAFKAVIVVKMSVHGCHGQIMMVVL